MRLPRDPDNPEKVMSIAAHLRELRKRLILALIGLVLGAVAGWFCYHPVMRFITDPLLELSGAEPRLNFQTIGGALDLQFRVSLWLGLLLSSPWWIAQAYAFIGPGMKHGEKVHVVTFGLVGMVLFAGGAASGVFFAPRAVEVLVAFVPDDALVLLNAADYVRFYTYLVTAFGLSFLLPELLVALNFLGVVTARGLLRGWRVAVIVAFTVAAVINPLPSPLPMILQALGLLVLYFLAVLVAHIHDRRKTKGQAEPA
ncbi:MAG: twin-arginine translocase subunit TatC [Bifidobacteriaceae bacterium]|jgi:sec-independent protein translocase protein TatC|nr:twin-arginine translocase subunit TatC [Bifidobacteriaceae bacterium]